MRRVYFNFANHVQRQFGKIQRDPKIDPFPRISGERIDFSKSRGSRILDSRASERSVSRDPVLLFARRETRNPGTNKSRDTLHLQCYFSPKWNFF